MKYILIILLTISSIIVNAQVRSKPIELPTVCFTASQMDSIRNAIGIIIYNNELLNQKIDLYQKLTDVQQEVIDADTKMINQLETRLSEYIIKENNKKKWYNNKLLYFGIGVVTGTVIILNFK